MQKNASIEITENVVRKQLAAMGSAVFELGFYRPDSRGGGPEMLPRTWDAEAVIRSIPWMRFQNLTGRNVYIRPRGEHELTLLDDLSADAVARLKSTGFAPALVVETSPGNFQAWLKHHRQLPKELSTAVARKLAAEFGADQGAADWRHFGRLVGYTNRKLTRRLENGQFPFVRLVEATGKRYPEAERFVDDIGKQLEHDATRRQRMTVHSSVGEQKHLKGIESFRANPIYGGDNTRVDLAYAVYALSRGVSEDSVAAAIRSRDLSHKGNERRQDEYVARTVNKALLTIEKNHSLSR